MSESDLLEHLERLYDIFSTIFYATSEFIPRGVVISYKGNPGMNMPAWYAFNPADLDAFRAGCPPGYRLMHLRDQHPPAPDTNGRIQETRYTGETDTPE